MHFLQKCTSHLNPFNLAIDSEDRGVGTFLISCLSAGDEVKGFASWINARDAIANRFTEGFDLSEIRSEAEENDILFAMKLGRTVSNIRLNTARSPVISRML